MALVNVSNATFDTALGLVPAPFGPFTRASGVDLDALPRVEPNSETRYEVVGQGGVHLFISYEELTNPYILQDRLRKAYGLAYRFREAQQVTSAIAVALNTIDAIDVTPAEYQDMMHLFQYLVPIVGHLNPKFNYSELSRDNAVNASFTVSTAPSAAYRTVVNTSTGLVDRYIWEWGDGDVTIQLAGEDDPAPHQYDADGTYVIKLTAIGAGGVDVHTDSEVVNVP